MNGHLGGQRADQELLRTLRWSRDRKEPNFVPLLVLLYAVRIALVELGDAANERASLTPKQESARSPRMTMGHKEVPDVG